jgi:hypothetical protein
MKLSLPLLLSVSVGTPSVFCHGSKDDELTVRRRAANGTALVHEKRNNFGTNIVGNMTTIGADGTYNRRIQTQENDYQALIVGGTQAKSKEFPYYGKST